jgi:sigma-54 specific flagellar transcriptional regulator A
VLWVLHGSGAAAAQPVLQAWRRACAREGLWTVEGACTAHGLPWEPVVRMVEQWWERLEALGLVDAALQALHAEIAGPLGLQPDPHPADADAAAPQAAQTRWLESVGEALCEASSRLPAAAMLLDVHLADASTWALLRHLVDHVFSDPVAAWSPDPAARSPWQQSVVLTVKDGSAELADLHALLHGRPGVHLIPLQGLERARMLEALQEAGPAADAALACARDPARWPALAGSLTQLQDTARAWQWMHLAPGFQDAWRLLEVLGPDPIEARWLAAVDPQLGWTRTLDALARAGLVERRGGPRAASVRVQRGWWSLPHAVDPRADASLRAALQARWREALREAWAGGDVAAAERILEALGPHADDPRLALELAGHFQGALAYQRATAWLQRVRPACADPALARRIDERLVALQTAMGEPAAALATLEAMDPQAEDAWPLAVQTIELRLALGRFAEALTAIQARDAMAVDAERRELLTALRADACYGLGRHEEALALAAAEARLLDHAEASPGLFRLANAAGKALLFLGRYDDAERMFAINRDRARAHGLSQEEVRALFNLATIRLQQRRHAEAEEMLRDCISLGGELTSLVTRSYLHLNLGVVHHRTHRWAEAMRAYLRALALFRRTGSEHQYAVTAINLASLYQLLGDVPRARGLAQSALEITRARDNRYFTARGLYVLARAEMVAGAWQQARHHLEQAHALLLESGAGPFALRVRLAMAQCLDESGEPVERDRWMQWDDLDGDPDEMRELRAEHQLWQGWFLLRAGKHAEALIPLAPALQTFEALSLHESTWMARLAQGLALAQLQDTERALDTLRAAAALLDHLAPEVPDSMRELWDMDGWRSMVRAAITTLEAGRIPRLARGEEGLPVLDAWRATPGFDRWRARYAGIIGQDTRLHQIFRMVDRISDSDTTVLIQGESGTGKELVSAAIHEQSHRRQGPFIKVNCAAFVETLLLSELFGHERGAFTGAVQRKKGRFELAHGGTLFLDEIGDISPNTQVALLRVLQERNFERVGGSETVDSDVRLICATNRNLEEMVRQGTFRLDLYYRLKGVVLEMPALRDRRTDIPLLVEHFCRSLTPPGRTPPAVEPDAMAYLVRYSWPGNIRELENFIGSLLLFVDGDRIGMQHIRPFDDFFADGEFLPQTPPFLQRRSVTDAVPTVARSGAWTAVSEPTPTEPPADRASAPAEAGVVPATPVDALDVPTVAAWALGAGIGLQDLKHRLEVEAIRQALLQSQGNITRAAALLDMKRPRLSQIIHAEPDLLALRTRLDAGPDALD